MNLLDALISQSGMDFRGFLSEYRRAASQLHEKTRDPSFRNIDLTEKTFTRWRSGRVARPHHPAPAILKLIFGRTVDELFAPHTGEQAQVVRAPSAPVLDESELSMTARDASTHASDAAAQLLPDLTLDQLEDDLVGLVQGTGTKPPHTIFVLARDVLGVSKVLLDRTQVPSQRQRLYLVAGQASALLSACAFDLGAIPHAFELARAAALYGQVAEYGPLQAYAHGYLAVLYYWTGKPAQAVRKIEEARSFPGVGATGKARLAAIAARAYAHRGLVENAQLAIEESLADRGLVEDDLHAVGGEFDFNLERVAMSNSSTLLILQDGPRAEASARRSLELIAARSAGSSPLVVAPQARADLASALLMRGDLDGAADALSPVLGLPREWRGAGLTARVQTIQAALLAMPTFRDAQLAQDLAERIEDFTLVAPSHVLGPGTARLALGRGDS
ncbi:hypothetical protein ACIQI7_09015 [Kitasatospora sp. NPDC092039]|uniref:hypothetical protein n=1 Tax=Kitasatospora sp. NPDC092039 TaxID=3364086 RepID=UPI003812934E